MKRLLAILTLLGATARGEVPKAVPVTEAEAAAPTPSTVEVPPRAVPGVEALQPQQARVVSTSQQFIITGGDPTLRGTVANLAEEAKTQLLGLGGLKDEWDKTKIPISIQLQGKLGDPLVQNPVQFDLFSHEKGWTLLLKLNVSRGIEQERFQKAITTALLYEFALRKMEPGDTDSPLIVRPWLMEGLREAIAWKEERSDRRLYLALHQRGGLYKMDDLFSLTDENYEVTDGAMRAAFRVSAGSLVTALVRQPGGKEGFKTFLEEAAKFGGEMPVLLRRCFPDLNLSDTSLAKWRALMVAEIGGANKLTDTLSVMDTDAALNEALKLHFRDENNAPLERPLHEGWRELEALPPATRVEAVRPVQDSLVRLSYRCFPSYRPLLAEYQAVLNELVAGKKPKTGYEEHLAKLEETRLTMRERMKMGQDYLIWFQITRAREVSGSFEDYLTLKDRLKYQLPVRRDPISTYLDQIQQIYDRKPSPGK